MAARRRYLALILLALLAVLALATTAVASSRGLPAGRPHSARPHATLGRGGRLPSRTFKLTKRVFHTTPRHFLARRRRIAVGPGAAPVRGFIPSQLGATTSAATAASITAFLLPAGTDPTNVALGADGNVWFIERHDSYVGEISPTGEVTEYALPFPNDGFQDSSAITTGPDGATWMTWDESYILRIDASGTITSYQVAPLFQPGTHVGNITTGPDGNLWLTPSSSVDYESWVLRFTPQGVLTQFDLPEQGCCTNEPFSIVPLNGQLYVVDSGADQVWVIEPDGTLDQFFNPNDNAYMDQCWSANECNSGFDSGAAAAYDGSVWFEGYAPASVITSLTPVDSFAAHPIAYGIAADFFSGMAAGPGGVWTVAATQGNTFGIVTPDDAFVPTPGGAVGLVEGSDGKMWFSSTGGNYIGVVTSPGAVAQSTTVGGGFPGSSQTTCWCGAPVNTATGEFSHSFTDFSISGRGVPLQFTRTYSSANAAMDGALGFGWTDSYQGWAVSVDSASGDVTVFAGNGSSVLFTLDGSGGFTAPADVHASLVENADGGYTFTQEQSLTSYLFSSRGQLTAIGDRNGYLTTLSYNTAGQLATVTEPAGRQLTFTYYPTGKLSSVTDPAGHQEFFTYDTADDVLTATDPAGGIWHFTYNSTTHRLLTMRDPLGHKTTNVYDSQGRIISQTDPMARKTVYSYTANANGSRTTTVTDPRGYDTTYTYDHLELQATTRAAGTAQAATTSYSYDPSTLRLASVTDPNGHVTTNTYDSSGNLLSKTEPLGSTTTYTYNSLNELLTATSPLGIVTANTYDTSGNLFSTQTGPAKTTYTYGDSAHPGDVTALTNPDGHSWTYGYDQYGDRTAITDPNGDKTTYNYNGIGERLAMVPPKGNATGATPTQYTTAYTYDKLGDVTSVTDPLGHTTINTYDADQHLVRVRDASGNLTISTFNADGEVTSTAQESSTGVVASSHSTTYDLDGNVTTQTDGLTNATTYAYNALDQLTSVTDPLGRGTTYTYDGVGNRLTITDPTSRTASYGYDAANHLVSVTYSDGTTPPVSYTYDADGRRRTMTDGTGTTSYNYDALNRVTASTNGAGQKVKYTYDPAGNVRTITYPGGATVATRTYDLSNRLKSVSDWLGHKTTYAYDSDSNLTTERLPDGVVSTETYNRADQLTAIKDVAGTTTLLSLADPRTPTGLAASDNGTPATYDPATRLTGFAGKYGYNTADQLTSTPTASFQYDTASQLSTGTTSAGTTTYTYSNEGNRTSQAPPSGLGVTYGYDQANHLTSYSASAATASYAYNGDGLRMRKTINGGTPERFVWDTADPTPVIIQDGSTAYLTGPGGLPLERITGTTVGYYLHDQLGSTRALVDQSGTITNAYSYDAYGQLTSSTASASQPFLFAGQYVDAESGLYYLRRRYFDPATSQFMTRDPLEAFTFQPYTYAGGDPLNAVDPSGLGYCPDGVAIPFSDNCLDNPLNFQQDAQNFDQNSQAIDDMPVVGTIIQADPFYDDFRDVYYAAQGRSISPGQIVADIGGTAALGIPGPGEIMAKFGFDGGEQVFAGNIARIWGYRVGATVANNPWIEDTFGLVVGGFVSTGFDPIAEKIAGYVPYLNIQLLLGEGPGVWCG